ncbi:sigma-54 interaction domain-containing protein [Viridibacillus arvi]|uniref:Transcriptional regulator n=1 Tax=Viridibacillus arvi TaxID=263475 RepID=A0A0M0LKL3_9BACL|nr:sigma 54-interacting transcriptional regulator [Viridibacillus arvi]KOO51620.1 transcriptional regulator [Viridibacillus arvi]
MYTTPHFPDKESNQLISLFTSIFSTSYDGLFVCDQNGYPLLYNQALLEICGMSVDYMNNFGNVFNLLKQGGLPNSASTVAIETKSIYSAMVHYYNGKKAILSATPILDDNQEVQFVVTNVRDVTEINRLQEELGETQQINTSYQIALKQAQEQLESQNQLIYKSKVMHQLVFLASRFAKNDSPILILGESGVGKDVMAQYIHKQSQRKGEFIKINCGAIPENLLESELFGYEKGSFTGANQSKVGLFEMAHKGTIFLDEIGDLPYPLQVKLLNVLQDFKIRKVGGTKYREVDMRVIAATNCNLESLIEQKKFRQDLYYRLNVLNFTIPPLRERQEDISTLLFYFSKKLEKKYGIEMHMDAPVLEKCLEYDWPGNIRELSNIVERMYHMSEDGKITLNQLPTYILNFPKIAIQNIDYNTSDITVPLKDAVKTFEKWYITQMLSQTSTMQECADKLGVNISTLVRKKRNLSIM